MKQGSSIIDACNSRLFYKECWHSLFGHHVLSDPAAEVGHSGVDTWVASGGAARDSPACSTCQVPLTIDIACQGAARVTLNVKQSWKSEKCWCISLDDMHQWLTLQAPVSPFSTQMCPLLMYQLPQALLQSVWVLTSTPSSCSTVLSCDPENTQRLMHSRTYGKWANHFNYQLVVYVVVQHLMILVITAPISHDRMTRQPHRQ